MTLTQTQLVEEQYQLKTYKKFPLTLVRGEDVWVWDEDGTRYLDLYGGHAVVSTGHCHPRVVEAIKSQAERFMFFSNLVYNDTRARAAKALGEVAPEGLKHIFFINSGAEANENAIKLARHMSGKSGIISFEGGFHGRTIGALSATGISKYREAFSPRIDKHFFLPFGDLDAVAALMEKEEIGGILLEPIQSMAGVCMVEPAYYQGLRALCDKHGAMLIYDEVQTGFGRTGTFFFSSRYGVTPDLATLAKGIASGMPMGAILTSDDIANRINYGDLGTTFGGGPLASAALEATIQTILEEDLLDNVNQQSEYMRGKLASIDGVVESLGLGYLMGIRFERPASDVQKALLKKQIITGLSGDDHVMRLLPPLTLKQQEIDLFLNALQEVLSALG